MSNVTVRHIMIPTRDGTRLSADLFLPGTGRPVPAVVEYSPYRKDDLRGARSDFAHFYLAGRDIASVCLDVRGTGDSEGFVTDEYQHPQEQQDGYDALEWLSRQDWCNGKTGMWGLSYPGFTALQVAQIQPPSLGAIVPMMATDDRYTDDMHFRGGALDGWSAIGPYAIGMVSRNALPPYPELAGDDWRDLWQLRLEKNAPWLIRWVEEQIDGPYWRSTLGRRYDQVRVPTFLICGWADFYMNAALRWFENLVVPKKLLMGPWPHLHPDAAIPGPRIDHLHEMARWFEQWLAGKPTGITDEPPVTVFIQHYRRPDAERDVAPGVWRFEERLPPARALERHWYLGGRLDLANSPSVADFAAEREYVPYVGFADLGFGGGGAGWGEQGANESFSIVFTSKPLATDVEILGMPRVTLHASADAEVAFFAARLCDVAPDQASTLVTKGLLNATRRAGMDRADPMPTGAICALSFQLDAASWVFPKGHRIRLAMSGSDFPEVWPSPARTTIRVHCGSSYPSRITLPVIPAMGGLDRTPELRAPAARRSRFKTRGAKPVLEIVYDVAARAMRARRALTETIQHHDGVTEIESEHRSDFTVSAIDPANARAEAWDRKTLRRPGWDVACTATATLQSATTAFHLDLALTVVENSSERWARRWTRTLPRRLL